MKIFSLPNIVLLFHRIPSRQWFSNIIIDLKKCYHFISSDELINYYLNKNRIDNFIHVTFDDGDKTVYTNAFPILKLHNIPASLFISPKIITEGINYWFQDVRIINEYDVKVRIAEMKKININLINRYSKVALLKCLKYEEIIDIIEKAKKGKYPPQNINLDELIEMHNSGIIEIGAHTISHPILMNESYDSAKKNIMESIELLSRLLNKKVKIFAYPNGIYGLDYCDREIKILKDSGVQIAYSTQIDYCSDRMDPFSIPRIGISGSIGKKIYLKLLFVKQWLSLRNLLKIEKPEDTQRRELIGRKLFSYVE